MNKSKKEKVLLKFKFLNSKYSFEEWINKNLKDISEVAQNKKYTLMIILLNKIKDEAYRQLKLQEKRVFIKRVERLMEVLKDERKEKQNK